MSAAGFTVTSDHPSLAGHFPGRPIVPGVVLLDEVFARLAASGIDGLALQTAKFTAPVGPGDQVEVSWQRTNEAVTFTGSVDGRRVLYGSARSL